MNDLIPFLQIGGLVLIVFLLMGLRARQRRLDRKLTLIMRFMQIDVNQAVSLSEQAKELARNGDKIGAIKRHRTETGVGLKEAKDAVEEFLAASA